jgi:hypothetical protein
VERTVSGSVPDDNFTISAKAMIGRRDRSENSSGFFYDGGLIIAITDAGANWNTVDCAAGEIFSDGFESGNTSVWSSTAGGP